VTRVFKYTLQVTDSQVVSMPLGAKILSIQVQPRHGSNQSDLQLWAQVDPELIKRDRHIRIFGTGHDISDDLDLEYLGTFQVGGGAMVFHAFEDLKEGVW